MVPRRQLGWLRATGAATLVAIALMVIAQILIVQGRYQAITTLGNSVYESGLRSAQVIEILYDAQLASGNPEARLTLADKLSSLRTHQQNLNDLRGAPLDSFNAFAATAARIQTNPNDAVALKHLDEVGQQLSAQYDQLTSTYSDAEREQRTMLRNIFVIVCGIILLVVIFMYFFVQRRRDDIIFQTMHDLEERRERFAAMFDNSLELMALYDPDGNIIRANPAAIARMGFGVEAVARHFEIHVVPRERELMTRHFNQALAGKASECTTHFWDVHQNEIPVIVSLAPVIVDKRVVAVVGSARDMTDHNHAEEELIRGREQFRSLFDYGVRPIIAMTPEGTLTHVNDAFLKMTGYERSEVIGNSALMLVSPERREMTEARVKGFEKTPHTVYEGLTLTKSGQEVPVEVEISPIRVRDNVEGYYVKYRDLSRERAIARAVSGKDDRMRALYRVASSNESASVQIGAALSLGARGLGSRYGFVCAAALEEFDVKFRCGPDDDVVPLGHRGMLTKSIGKRLREHHRALANDDLSIDPDFVELGEMKLPWRAYIGTRIMLGDTFYGTLVFVDNVARSVPFDNADLDFVDVVGTMITSALAREAHDKELEQQAFHDTLTGAVNRRLFEEHVLKAMARSHRLRGAIALHYFDLDGFKAINDRHGHEAGDEVLCEVVRRLTGVVRKQDIVARIGGDEFVVLETDMPQDMDSTAAASRMSAEFDRPMLLSNGATLEVRASMGTAVYPRDGAGLSDLLKHADRAMYENKRPLS